MDSAMSSRFVLPVIAENMFTIATTMITTQVISTISSSALAAIGMANTVWNVIVALFSVVTTGTVLLVARQIGADDREAAADTIEQSILLSISVSAMISVIGILSARWLLKLLMPTAEEALYMEAVRYYRIVLLSLAGLITTSMLSGVSRGLGDSRTPLIANTTMNLSLVFFAWLFVNKLRMEEVGAGLAYVGCRIVGISIMLYSVIGRNRQLSISLKRIFRPHFETIKHICQIGLPVSVESIFVQVGYLVAGSMSIALGTFRSTVYQVMNTLTNFTSIPQAICAAITMTAVGHLLGAKKEKESRKAANIIYIVGMITSALLLVGLFAGGKFFVSIYSTDEEVVAKTLKNFWILIPYTAVCMGVNCTDPQLRAGGDVRFVMCSTLIAVWIIRLPLTYLFCFVLDWGEIGIYAANTIALFQRASVGLIRRSGKKWIKKAV